MAKLYVKKYLVCNYNKMASERRHLPVPTCWVPGVQGLKKCIILMLPGNTAYHMIKPDMSTTKQSSRPET